MKGSTVDKEDLDSTLPIDTSLVQKLRSATQSKRLKGSPASSAPSAKRRSVSFGVATNASRTAAKRLVAEPQPQPQTPRRQVNVPVEVISDRRATSLPPVVAPARAAAPHHFQLGARRGKTALAPEVDWWQQVQVPERQHRCGWGSSAFFSSSQTSESRQSPMHKVWVAPQAEKLRDDMAWQRKSNMFTHFASRPLAHSRQTLRTPSPCRVRPTAEPPWPPAYRPQTSHTALPGVLHSGVLEPVYWPGP